MTLFLRHRTLAAITAAIILPVVSLASPTPALAEPAPLSQHELDWAREALGRNTALEVVASDPATGWITVRVRRTGELRKVFAGSLIAMLPGDAPTATASNSGSDQGAAAPSKPAPVPAAPRGEHVLLSGPGYSIAAASPATNLEPRSAGAAAAAAGVGAALANGLPVEHLHEPIVCQGAQLLHIDSRNFEFDGDALSVQNGCEVYITNSRITAKGIGVEARAASVHIDNSSIEGGSGSIEASDGAQVYASSSTFKGLIRRLDTASFHDMGGNVGD